MAQEQQMMGMLEKILAGQANLEEQVQFISANVARIENEQDKQFKAIHDKFSLNDDFAEGYAPRMIKLEHRVNNLEVDVVHLKTARGQLAAPISVHSTALVKRGFLAPALAYCPRML